jgi:hypothetical protein
MSVCIGGTGFSRGVGYLPGATFQKELIVTLLVTILLESVIVISYCLWRGKPLQPVLFTSLCGNLITQSLLRAAVSLFFQHYLITLFIAELFIWFIESALLHLIPANTLRFPDAVFLSLAMNLLSFTVGWFLPI